MATVTSENHFQVIVVGGGPAGSSLARLTAKAGLRTLIIERACHPRTKPCGGMLSYKAVQLFGSIFDTLPLDSVACGRSGAFGLFHNGAMVGESDSRYTAVFVRRPEFDAALLACAQDAGCTVVQGDAVVSVCASSGLVTFASGATFRADVIVGADGVRSAVGRSAGLALSREDMGFGIINEVPRSRLTADTKLWRNGTAPQVHFGAVEWGYGWVFPKGDCLHIGVGGLTSSNRRFDLLMDRFVSSVLPGVDTSGLERQGHLLPLGNFLADPGKGRVLLIGDAAGFADPITGEGLAFAFESAKLAAQAIITGIGGRDQDQPARRYCADAKKLIIKPLTSSMRARPLLYSASNLPRAMNRLRRDPSLVAAYQEIGRAHV